MKKLATKKQKDFMDKLEIEYDEDVTLEEASDLISEELELRDELNGYSNDPEFYK